MADTTRFERYLKLADQLAAHATKEDLAVKLHVNLTSSASRI